MTGKKVLLVVGGGIAAYKSCELVRLLRKEGADVTCVLTDGGAHFVTAMTLAALSENPVHTTLWDLKNEVEMGHIQLSRQADLVVVCPATADLMARMAGGIANDLATTLLLATDKPVLAVPAMNVRMWQHPATQRNVAALRGDGITVMEPDEGAMACGEFGPGRLPEPAAICAEISRQLGTEAKPLAGKHILITAGPTHEPIDPVRYIANRSSGKQGYAIAAAAARAGATVTLISGPVNLPTPPGVTVHPTPIYEIIAMLVVVWILWRLATRYDKSGWWTFGWFLVLSGIERFLVEFVRINPIWFAGLTQPQWVSIVSVVIGVALILAFGKKPAVLAGEAARPSRAATRRAARAR